MTTNWTAQAQTDFSLVLGGPLFQLCVGRICRRCAGDVASARVDHRRCVMAAFAVAVAARGSRIRQNGRESHFCATSRPTCGF